MTSDDTLPNLNPLDEEHFAQLVSNVHDYAITFSPDPRLRLLS